MIAEIRRLAEEAAQAAFKEACNQSIKTGTWDPGLEASYLAAERIVKAVDDYERTMQETDPDAPTYLGSRCCGAGGSTPHWYRCPSRFVPEVETELRAAFGDR